MKSSELEAMSVEERVSCFYCAFGVDFIGVNVALSEALIAPEAVPTYLQYLEGPNRDAWLLAESVLIPFAQGKGMKDEQQRLLVNFEVARRNCDVLSAAGAVPIFAQHLARAMLNLKGLNFPYMDIDQVERLFGQLNRALTMLYLTIVLSPESVCSARSLFELGVCQPKQVLFDIFECLQAHQSVAGYPVKRTMLLLYAWFTRMLGDLPRLTQLKNDRRAFHALPLEVPTKLQCKSIKRPVMVPITEPVSDPLYVAKVKAQNHRDSIYTSYIHKPHYDMAPAISATDDPTFDQEWGDRVELLYRMLLMPRAKEIMGVFASVLAAGTNPDKRHVFGKRGSAGTDPSSYENAQTNVSPEEQAYLTYMLREKAILMDATSLTLLTLLKHVRSSHLLKAEYLASQLVDAGVLPTMTKFLNRDFATYVQVRVIEDGSQRVEKLPSRNKKLTVVVALDEATVAEYARQQLRCVASVLRLVQRLTKRKPSLIKSTLCRSQSLVWLKRVLNLKEPMTRLYALKLVKSQARYLGHQWVRKFTCVHLLTEVYLYVRPELEDDWLRSEEDDTNVTSAPKPVETLLAGEVQAYHHKYYWDRLKPSPAASNVSIVVQSMQDLEADGLDVEGGSCRKLFAELKLDTGTCQQYEKWLDIQGLMADADAPLPIAFG
ncbi:hypothetical protein SDRG_03816 [Saprolegnia diclina VS20]|uniref:Far11/STRP C-terminal domain-containing protein n=1 Tax=Saprolegnia diclina (strain VS20) TaxID=1156394 RepID=T0S1G1_SAPDV|nr:hypothetical protein SDRG_03816 [Saprolegnia diclina VS20]EQC38858.1 hypothetical protein SDRG_03816 [Saprolegnia diclina VS20]|eukprot:XP_008607682.1 hypothetical protein SDRG_03816 [Saprolegnia diclina VS20]